MQLVHYFLKTEHMVYKKIFHALSFWASFIRTTVVSLRKFTLLPIRKATLSDVLFIYEHHIANSIFNLFELSNNLYNFIALFTVLCYSHQVNYTIKCINTIINRLYIFPLRIFAIILL